MLKIREPDAVGDVMRHLRRFAGLRLPEIGELFRKAFIEWSSDNGSRLGASIAFYTLLSLAPLLVVVVGVAALFYGKEAAQGQLFGQLQDIVGQEAARAIQGVLDNAYKPRTGIFATVLGLLTLAFGASSFVVEVRDVLNVVWKAPAPSSGVGLRSVIFLAKERFHAFAIVAGAGFLLLVSLVLNASLAAAAKLLTYTLSIPGWLLHVTNFLLSFLVIAGLFAAIYSVLPEVRLTWSDVAVGASITSLLFTIGKQLIGLYLGTAGIGSAYGAAGSLVLVLLWVYYSAQLFLFGAEFTKVYARTFGSHISPTQLKQ